MHTHARTHIRTHAHTHTYTHTLHKKGKSTLIEMCYYAKLFFLILRTFYTKQIAKTTQNSGNKCNKNIQYNHDNNEINGKNKTPDIYIKST